MYLLLVVIFTIIVFLLVFFLSWWGKIHLMSCFALACTIAFLFMVILYPPVQMATDAVKTVHEGAALIIIYWIIYALFIFYIFVYIIYKSVTDDGSCERGKNMSESKLRRELSISEASEELLY